jgi:glycosyltransferase involved in cell wall biosynthesis
VSDDRAAFRLTAVIPTHDRLEKLRRVLGALEAQEGEVPGGLEIVVVDDGSSDGTAGELASWRRAGRVLLTQARSGPAVARNRGARAASGERLLFLGDDTTPEPGCLAAHLQAHAAARGGTSAADVAVLGYTGWDRERVRVTPLLEHLNENGLQFGYALIEDGQEVPFNFFYTSNVSLPRELFLSLGGFDETFPHAAWEDVELAYRATRRTPPLRLVYRAAARTRHDHEITLASFRQRQRRAGAAAAVFVARHPELSQWLGAGRAREAPVRRPAEAWSCELLVRLLDPVRIGLPAGVYDRVFAWDYLDGLRDGMSRLVDGAAAGALHLRPLGTDGRPRTEGGGS